MDPPSAKRGKVNEKTAEQRREAMDRRNARDRERRRAETPEQTRERLEKRRAREKAKRENESDQNRYYISQFNLDPSIIDKNYKLHSLLLN